MSSFFTVSVFEMVPLLDFGGFLSFWARLEVVVSLESNPSSSDVLRRLDRRFGATDNLSSELSAFLFAIVPWLVQQRNGTRREKIMSHVGSFNCSKVTLLVRILGRECPKGAKKVDRGRLAAVKLEQWRPIS